MFYWLSFSLLLSLSFSILNEPQYKGVIRYNTHTYTQPWDLNLQQKVPIPNHRIGPKIPKTANLMFQSQPEMVASEMRKFRNVATKLVESEERDRMLKSLLSKGIGLREEEEFMKNEESKLRGGKAITKKKEIIQSLMKNKIRDNVKWGEKLRRLKNKTKGKIEAKLGKDSEEVKNLLSNVKQNQAKTRTKLRKKNLNKVEFLTKKYKQESEALEELNSDDRKTYGGAKIFKTDCEMVPDTELEPVVVCRHGEEIVLSKDEQEILSLGGKFNILSNLDEENFEVEVEQMLMKYRWEIMGEENKTKNRKTSLSDIALNVLFDDEELKQIEDEQNEELELEEAKTRQVFCADTLSFDYSKRRATDLKSNSRVIFPSKTSFEVESKLELVRTELLAAFKSYSQQNCKKKGQQTSNLTSNQLKGLKSLKTRIKNGELVVIPTDKTGKLAVLTRETYTLSGLEHTKKDRLVGWDEVQKSQTELNGHVSMLIKTFKISENWGHVERTRETMMGNSLNTCPVTLMYKDHKNWKPGCPGLPPTRQVIGGHVGINVHVSEIVSDIVEVVADHVKGGKEAVSTEDMIAGVENLNLKMEG